VIGSMHLVEIDLRHAFGTVADAMTREVVTFSPEMTVADAVVSLERHGIGGAPVVEHDRVVGVVTMRDLCATRPHAATTGPFLRPGAHRADWTVGDVMTRSPVVAEVAEPLADAIERMDRADVDRLPVVGSADAVVGWLTTHDVVHSVSATLERHRRSSDRRPLQPPD
jgi:CBS domain-containing protein